VEPGAAGCHQGGAGCGPGEAERDHPGVRHGPAEGGEGLLWPAPLGLAGCHVVLLAQLWLGALPNKLGRELGS
jgi:hypothetical protein